jgi:hypothetical protein
MKDLLHPHECQTARSSSILHISVATANAKINPWKASVQVQQQVSVELKYIVKELWQLVCLTVPMSYYCGF